MKKYIILAFLTLGLLCGPITLFTIKYECTGGQGMPIYYGSPFIYKSTSLATSLAYNYYLKGFLANWIIWFFALLLLQNTLKATSSESDKKVVVLAYNFLIFVAVIVTMLNLTAAFFTFGDTGIEYLIDLEKVENDWGVVCQGRWYFLGSL